jgi:hypothetical protein
MKHFMVKWVFSQNCNSSSALTLKMLVVDVCKCLVTVDWSKCALKAVGRRSRKAVLFAEECDGLGGFMAGAGEHNTDCHRFSGPGGV